MPVIDHAAHTRFSDPGAHRSLVAALAVEPDALSAVARNLIVHYRASGHELPDATRGDVNARWVERILELDQERHPYPLDRPREVAERVQGCCRDHTLFCVATLREHGIPARSRVGFAGYFVDGWHHDHVIVEAWLEGRWRRFDSELDAPSDALPTPMDIDWDAANGTGFITAAAAWAAHRRGEIDATSFGVDPEMPLFAGERFLYDEVIYEVAHRFGDELLLWDMWGAIGPIETVPDDTAKRWIDGVADLLLAADAGDLDAEHRLYDQYRTDPGLRPGPTILQASPFGDELVPVSLDGR